MKKSTVRFFTKTEIDEINDLMHTGDTFEISLMFLCKNHRQAERILKKEFFLPYSLRLIHIKMSNIPDNGHLECNAYLLKDMETGCQSWQVIERKNGIVKIYT